MRIRTLVVAVSLAGSSVAGAQVFGGQSMQLNGSGGSGTPLITGGGVLRLTQDQFATASSAFTTDQFIFDPTTSWSTVFRLHYAFTSPDGFDTAGDGVAFVMQGGDATALGFGGGDMGYGGIGNSFAVSFRSFWNDLLLGVDGNTAAAAIQDGSSVPTPDFVMVAGQELFLSVALSYDGADHLTVHYLSSRGADFTNIVALDPTSLGSRVRLGFTAGTGGATELSEVSDWRFDGLEKAGATSATPEPATVTLVGLGTLGLGVFAKRRRRA